MTTSTVSEASRSSSERVARGISISHNSWVPLLSVMDAVRMSYRSGPLPSFVVVIGTTNDWPGSTEYVVEGASISKS